MSEELKAQPEERVESTKTRPFLVYKEKLSESNNHADALTRAIASIPKKEASAIDPWENLFKRKPQTTIDVSSKDGTKQTKHEGERPFPAQSFTRLKEAGYSNNEAIEVANSGSLDRVLLMTKRFNEITQEMEQSFANRGEVLLTHLPELRILMPHLHHNQQYRLLESTVSLCESKDDSVKSQVVDFMIDALPTALADGLGKPGIFSGRNKTVDYYSSMFTTVRRNANEAQLARMRTFITDLMESDNPSLRQEAIHFMMPETGFKYDGHDKNDQSQREGLAMARNLLEQYGFNADEAMEIWRKYSMRGLEYTSIAENLNSIYRLEQAKPGAAKDLYDDHVVFFRRYGTDQLLYQHETRNKDMRYVYVVNPFADTLNQTALHVKEGPFEMKQQYFADLSEKLKKHNIALRVYDTNQWVDNGPLQYAKERYGNNHRIDTLIIGGHGVADAIVFDWVDVTLEGKIKDIENNPSIFHVSDLTKGAGDPFADYVVTQGTIILDSCSTGQLLGPEVSKHGYETLAATEPTEVDGLDVDFDSEEQMRWYIKFTTSDTFDTKRLIGARFKNGMMTGSSWR